MGADPKSLKRTRGGRERLLAAAADLFGAHSLAGTSLQMIADRLGVSKPAIYHHFRSRDEIVATLMQPVVDDARTALDRIDLCDTPEERSRAAREFYIDFVITHRQVINMVFFDRASLPGDLPSVVDSLVDRLAKEFADGETGRPEATAVVYGAAAVTAHTPDRSDDALRDDLERILDLLRGRGTASRRPTTAQTAS